jgi:hypothetical protein
MNLLNSKKYTPGFCVNQTCYNEDEDKGNFNNNWNRHCMRI